MVALPDDVRERVTGYIKHDARKPLNDIAAIVADSQERLRAALDGVDAAESAIVTDDEPWSPRDLLRHIIASERLVSALVADLARGEAPPPRRGGIGMMLDDDGSSFEDLRRNFHAAGDEMARVLAELGDAPDTSITRPHPFFGELNCLEWAIFQRVHDEDHINHLGKMKASIRG